MKKKNNYRNLQTTIPLHLRKKNIEVINFDSIAYCFAQKGRE